MQLAEALQEEQRYAECAVTLNGTSILQTYFVFIPLFSKKILTEQNKPYTKGSRFRGELKPPTYFGSNHPFPTCSENLCIS